MNDPRRTARISAAIGSLRNAANSIDNGVKAMRELGIPDSLVSKLGLMATDCRKLADAISGDTGVRRDE